MVVVHDSDGNSKEEREKDQNVDSAPAAGDGSEEDASDGGVDSEENVPVADVAASKEGGSKPVEGGDGVSAEAPVGGDDGSLARAVMHSGGSPLVGDGGKGVSAESV